MSTREIITLQFGHYANFVGAHWWNLQEANFSYDPNNPSEINHDVLYREGENLRRETTFTPRLLLVDLKGANGHLNQLGDLYGDPTFEDDHQSELWDAEKLEVAEEELIPKSKFVQSLENSDEPGEIDPEKEIDSWVDFLVPRFHPRSLNIVNEYKHKCTERAFDIFNYGADLWHSRKFDDDFADRIRSYAEECDRMQGFQVLLDASDGFGGLATSCIEYLRDEYGKSILAFPLLESALSEPSAADIIRSINIVMCFNRLGEYASLFSPLSCEQDGCPRAGPARTFNHLIYNQNSKYHTSALLATALDTMSIRYRHKENTMASLSDLCADLKLSRRSVAAMSLSLPFPMTAGEDLIDVLDTHEGPIWTSLTPQVDISGDETLQSIGLRGIPEERLKRPMQQAGKQMEKNAYRCSSVHEMMTMYFACNYHVAPTYLTNISAGLKLSPAFPRFFKDYVNGEGNIGGSKSGEVVKTTPVLAGLHSTVETAKLFAALHKQMSRVRSISRYPALVAAGFTNEDFVESMESLRDFEENDEEQYY